MKKVLEILEVEERVSKKSGNKYRVAQCIVRGDNVRVGELMVFKPEIELKPGQFEAEFDVSVNFDRNVAAELVSLRPLNGAKPAPAART